MKRLFALGAIAVAASAHAGGMVVRSEYAASQSLIQAASSGSDSTFTRLVNQTYKIGMSDLVRFPGPGGAAVEGRLALALTERGALSVAARALALAGPAGVTAMGLYTLYEVYDRIRTRADGNGGLAFDPGTDPVEKPGWEYQGPHSQDAWYRWTGLVEKERAYLNSTVGSCVYQGAASPGQQWTVYAQVVGSSVQFRQGACPGYTGASYTTVSRLYERQTMVLECPSAGGEGAGVEIGFDGKCATGNYSVPKTPDEAGDMRGGASGRPGVPDIDYPKLMPDVMKGYGPDGFPIPQDTGYEMPAPGITPNVVQGATTTTTKPDGSTQTDTEEWRAGTANSIGGPNGNRLVVPWSKSTTTTTRDPQGNPTGTTTTTTNPGTAPAPSAGASAAGGDPCATDPGRLGCIGLGQAPSDQVPKRAIALAYATEAVSLPSGCPPDYPLWGGRVFRMQGACDAATGMRPFILAGTAFGCLLLCVKALRGA